MVFSRVMEEIHSPPDLMTSLARSLDQLDVVLKEDRHADGGDQRRQPEGAAQGPVGQPLDRPAIDAGEDHGDDQHQQQHDRDPGDAGGAKDDEADDGDEGADHVNLAMGEIDHADDAVDHRVADRDQAVDGAERQPVDQLLKEVFHILDTQTWIAAERRRSLLTTAATGSGSTFGAVPIRTTRTYGAAAGHGADEIADSRNSPGSSFRPGGGTTGLVVAWTLSYPLRAGKR